MQQSSNIFDQYVLADLIMYLVIVDNRIQFKRSVSRIGLMSILPTFI